VPSSRRSSPRSTPDPVQMAAFFQRLFGDRRGIVILAFGVGGHFTQTGRYAFKSFRHRYFDYPDQLQKIIDTAVRAALEQDVYVIPNLRSARSASNGSCLGSEYCWADIDRLPAITLARLRTVMSNGSFLVRSGRGRHAYILMDGFYAPDIIAAPNRLNQQLAHFLPADGKWNDCALLRLPGCFNHKDRAKGGESSPVVLEEPTVSAILPWSPSALSEVLGPLPERSEPKPGPIRKKTNRKMSSQRQPVVIVPVKAEPIPKDLPAEIVQMLEGAQPPNKAGDRSGSGQIYALVGRLMSLGYTDGVIMGVVMTYSPAVAKRQGLMARSREIQRCISKLRLAHPHSGLSCNEAGCRSINANLIARLHAIKTSFDTFYVSATKGTESKILDSFIDLTKTFGSLELDVSYRELAERSSIGSLSTVGNGLKRLGAARYVRVLRLSNGNPIRRGDGPGARRSYRYELKMPRNGDQVIKGSDVDNTDTHNSRKGRRGTNRGVVAKSGGEPRCNPQPVSRLDPRPSVGNRSSGRNPSHLSNNQLPRHNSKPATDDPRTLLLEPGLDMWRRTGGLSVARLTFNHLIPGPITPTQLASLQSCGVKTVRRHLKKLEQVGLAVNANSGKWEAQYRDPDEVAMQVGTLGMRVKQADRHSIERKLHEEHVVARDESDVAVFQDLIERFGHYWN
jgi:hypothetical protein